MKSLVEPNIFVRFLTGADSEKAERCLSLFEGGRRREFDLYTSESIIAEVAYVLSSKQLYAKSRIEIADSLPSLLEGRGIRLDHKSTVVSALGRYRNGQLDFEDCIAVEHVLRLCLNCIPIYDRKLCRKEGITRLEP